MEIKDMIEAFNALKEKRTPQKESDNLTELCEICISLRDVGITDKELEEIKLILFEKLIDVRRCYVHIL